VSYRFGRKLAGAYISRGDGRDDLDQHAQAILDYDLALELDPDDPRIYSFRAYSRTRLDLYQEAIPDFDRAIEIDPQSAWSYRWRGGAYARLKDYEKAIADYNASLELDPRAVTLTPTAAMRHCRRRRRSWPRAGRKVREPGVRHRVDFAFRRKQLCRDRGCGHDG
jgi:tetratricopeptide (TPR) repeat protein